MADDSARIVGATARSMGEMSMPARLNMPPFAPKSFCMSITSTAHLPEVDTNRFRFCLYGDYTALVAHGRPFLTRPPTDSGAVFPRRTALCVANQAYDSIRCLSPICPSTGKDQRSGVVPVVVSLSRHRLVDQRLPWLSSPVVDSVPRALMTGVAVGRRAGGQWHYSSRYSRFLRLSRADGTR